MHSSTTRRTLQERAVSARVVDFRLQPSSPPARSQQDEGTPRAERPVRRTRDAARQLGPVVRARRNVLDLAHDEHRVLADDLAEHDVLAVEERRRVARDEELAPVRVRARVGLRVGPARWRGEGARGRRGAGRRSGSEASARGSAPPHDVTHLEDEERERATHHAEQPGLVMRHLERLVLKLGPVDARAARPVGVDKVAALDHEVRDDAASVCWARPGSAVRATSRNEEREEGAHRWKMAFLYPTGSEFSRCSPVQNCRKFSAVLCTEGSSSACALALAERTASETGRERRTWARCRRRAPS